LTSSVVTVGGVNYTLSNGTVGNATINYKVPAIEVLPTADNPSDIACVQLSPKWTVPWPNPEVAPPIVPRELTIALPTNPSTSYYTLYFGDYNPDPTVTTNNYGLINEIIYPDGGWVKYTWTIPPTTSPTGAPNYTQSATFPGVYFSPSATSPNPWAGQPAPFGCAYEYSTPVVSTRQVSYDGTNVAQTQSFSYSTQWGTGDNVGTWTSKSTTITTTDNLTGKSAKTTYMYQPGSLAVTPVSVWGSVAPVFPVEQTITRYDWSNATTGTPLDTETKGWFSGTQVSQLACDFHTLNNGQSTGHFYQYSPVAPSQISDDKQFDYGQIANPATYCTGNSPAPPSGVVPIRETATSYTTFTLPLGVTFAKPSSVVTYGNGAKIAETDYAYDQFPLGQAISPALPSGTHDETNRGPSTIANRGNVTTVTLPMHRLLECDHHVYLRRDGAARFDDRPLRQRCLLGHDRGQSHHHLLIHRQSFGRQFGGQLQCLSDAGHQPLEPDEELSI